MSTSPNTRARTFCLVCQGKQNLMRLVDGSLWGRDCPACGDPAATWCKVDEPRTPSLKVKLVPLVAYVVTLGVLLGAVAYCVERGA